MSNVVWSPDKGWHDGPEVQTDRCVGFADCPCKRCRGKRSAVTAAHPDHDRRDVSYCGACLQAERDRHDARRFAAMRPSYRELNPARNDRPAS